MIRRSVVAAALVTIGLVGTACGDSTSETADPTAAPGPWDPCTISDEALIRASLDPASEGPGSLAQGQPGWKSCEWEGPDVAVIVSASSTTGPDHFRNFPGNTDFQDVTVAGREGFTYRQEADESGTFCWLTVPMDNGGVVDMQFDRSPFSKDTTPMCDWAVRVGEVLVAEVPR
ncbi:DUF3558 domain-containing protein [Rhodococcus rhodnii]|nr:DUF3558 domain-containing protein [Rhodococcus rhodnii]